MTHNCSFIQLLASFSIFHNLDSMLLCD